MHEGTAVDVDLVGLAIADEHYHQSVVDFLKGLTSGLVVRGYDDADAASIAMMACGVWAAGLGAVSDRARALAAEEIAVMDEAQRALRLAPHGGVAPSVHHPRPRPLVVSASEALVPRRYVVVPSVHRGHR